MIDTQLKSTALCININKGIKANELVDLAYYPLSHQVRRSHRLSSPELTVVLYRYRTGTTWESLRFCGKIMEPQKRN